MLIKRLAKLNLLWHQPLIPEHRVMIKVIRQIFNRYLLCSHFSKGKWSFFCNWNEREILSVDTYIKFVSLYNFRRGVVNIIMGLVIFVPFKALKTNKKRLSAQSQRKTLDSNCNISFSQEMRTNIERTK